MSAAPITDTNTIDLRKFHFTDIDNDLFLDYKCIPRDKLTDYEISVLRNLLKILYNRMDKDQKRVYNSLIDDMNNPDYCKFDTDNPSPEVKKVPMAILNAPAGTGKTYVSLAFLVRTILDYGYKNGAIMYTPSYSAKDAVTDKITECFEDHYRGSGSGSDSGSGSGSGSGSVASDFDRTIVEKKSRTVLNCLPIYILNTFYACGPKSFNIHDPSVSAEVIKKFKRARFRNKYDHYKLNNVQAIREARAIIVDEAFFSTENRCNGFIDMLMKGYIDHPYLNREIRAVYPNLLDRLVFKKKIVFSGDPYQLSVSVEAKQAGVEKYLHEDGNPLWLWKNQLRDCIRLSVDISKKQHYQVLTLKKNYRFKKVPKELSEAIQAIRLVIYKDECGFDIYKEDLRYLLTLMKKYGMIEFNTKETDVVKEIESVNKHKSVIVTETHAVRKRLNKLLDKNNLDKRIPYRDISSKFVYGKVIYIDKANWNWEPYDKKVESIEKVLKRIEFERRYKQECKSGIIANRFIGPQYPNQPIDDFVSKLFIGDKVRITYPLGSRHNLTRVLGGDREMKLKPNFKLATGTFGCVVGFKGMSVHIEIINTEESNKYNKELGKKTVKLPDGRKTTNPIFSIKYSEELKDPYFKSAFFDYIIKKMSFNLAVHSYPFTKESSSTIHSLQGKTYDCNVKIIYYMASIKKKDLDGAIYDKVGAWKGSLPNFLYVALTRSKTPHTNFKLMTSARNISELLKKITCGKRPNSYKDLKEFNEQFDEFVAIE